MENDTKWTSLEHLQPYFLLKKRGKYKYIEIQYTASHILVREGTQVPLILRPFSGPLVPTRLSFAAQCPRRSFPISSSETSARLARRKTLCSNSFGRKTPQLMVDLEPHHENPKQIYNKYKLEGYGRFMRFVVYMIFIQWILKNKFEYINLKLINDKLWQIYGVEKMN